MLNAKNLPVSSPFRDTAMRSPNVRGKRRAVARPAWPTG
jgi:hypothetical protein